MTECLLVITLALLQHFLTQLGRQFDMKGNLHFIDFSAWIDVLLPSGLVLTQTKYALDLLRRVLNPVAPRRSSCSQLTAHSDADWALLIGAPPLATAGQILSLGEPRKSIL